MNSACSVDAGFETSDSIKLLDVLTKLLGRTSVVSIISKSVRKYYIRYCSYMQKDLDVS